MKSQADQQSTQISKQLQGEICIADLFNILSNRDWKRHEDVMFSGDICVFEESIDAINVVLLDGEFDAARHGDDPVGNCRLWFTLTVGPFECERETVTRLLDSVSRFKEYSANS